jgi:hypothetical protein
MILGGFAARYLRFERFLAYLLVGAGILRSYGANGFFDLTQGYAKPPPWAKSSYALGVHVPSPALFIRVD